MAIRKAYPADSGSATCRVLNDRIRSVAETNIDGQRAFADDAGLVFFFKSVSRRGPVNPLPVREPIPPEDCI
jgi:hypothetical protein